MSKLCEFMGAMLEELKNNMHKGGWENDSKESLFRRVGEELEEFLDEMAYVGTDGFSAEKITSEAADVANMIMMVADRAIREHEEKVGKK